MNRLSEANYEQLQKIEKYLDSLDSQELNIVQEWVAGEPWANKTSIIGLMLWLQDKHPKV